MTHLEVLQQQGFGGQLNHLDIVVVMLLEQHPEQTHSRPLLGRLLCRLFSGPLGCLTALLSHCQLYGVALPAKDHASISVLYISFCRLSKSLTSAGLLCCGPLGCLTAKFAALPALWSCASCKGPCVHQSVVHQLLPTVKDFDKSRTALLDLLIAILPGLPHCQLHGVAQRLAVLDCLAACSVDLLAASLLCCCTAPL